MKVGACNFDLEATESLKGPLEVRDQNGCPALTHSNSTKASNLQLEETLEINHVSLQIGSRTLERFCNQDSK